LEIVSNFLPQEEQTAEEEGKKHCKQGAEHGEKGKESGRKQGLIYKDFTPP
jgi:hypothetical protein